jgi:hypothetical protein
MKSWLRLRLVRVPSSTLRGVTLGSWRSIVLLSRTWAARGLARTSRVVGWLEVKPVACRDW